MKNPILYCDDGSEIELPFKWEICSHCEGEGMSSAYLGAYTREDMDEAGPEFMAEYMAGAYDKPCDCCGGSGKVKIADRSKMTKAQRTEYDAQLKAIAEVDAEERHERRQLGGW